MFRLLSRRRGGEQASDAPAEVFKGKPSDEDSALGPVSDGTALPYLTLSTAPPGILDRLASHRIHVVAVPESEAGDSVVVTPRAASLSLGPAAAFAARVMPAMEETEDPADRDAHPPGSPGHVLAPEVAPVPAGTTRVGPVCSAVPSAQVVTEFLAQCSPGTMTDDTTGVVDAVGTAATHPASTASSPRELSSPDALPNGEQEVNTQCAPMSAARLASEPANEGPVQHAAPGTPVAPSPSVLEADAEQDALTALLAMPAEPDYVVAPGEDAVSPMLATAPPHEHDSSPVAALPTHSLPVVPADASPTPVTAQHGAVEEVAAAPRDADSPSEDADGGSARHAGEVAVTVAEPTPHLPATDSACVPVVTALPPDDVAAAAAAAAAAAVVDVPRDQVASFVVDTATLEGVTRGEHGPEPPEPAALPSLAAPAVDGAVEAVDALSVQHTAPANTPVHYAPSTPVHTAAVLAASSPASVPVHCLHEHDGSEGSLGSAVSMPAAGASSVPLTPEKPGQDAGLGDGQDPTSLVQLQGALSDSVDGGLDRQRTASSPVTATIKQPVNKVVQPSPAAEPAPAGLFSCFACFGH